MLTVIPFVSPMRVVQGQRYSYNGTVYEALKDIATATAFPRVGASYKLAEGYAVQPSYLKVDTSVILSTDKTVFSI